MKNRCLQKLSPLEKLIRILKNNLSIQHIKILRLTKNNFGFHGLLPSDLNITHLPIFVKRYYKYEKIIVPIPNIINEPYAPANKTAAKANQISSLAPQEKNGVNKIVTFLSLSLSKALVA